MKIYYLLSFVVISFLSGCSESSSPTDDNIIQHNISVNPNQNFSFELDICTDAGYQWDYTISDASIVSIDSINYRPKSGNWHEVGGSRIETFYCSSKRIGKCVIDLIEHQAWMTDVEPINRVRYNVNVKRLQ